MRNMKDSGISWIGRIPEEWKLIKYKYFCDVFAGGTPDTNNPFYYDGNIPWIQSGKVQNCIIYGASRYITELGVKGSSTKFIPENTAVLAMTGGTCGNVGFTSENVYGNQSIMAFVNKNKEKIYDKYIYWTLYIQKDGILINQNGSAQAGINVDSGKNLYMPCPMYETQIKISKFLDEKILEIENIINKTKETILEYKKNKISLIDKIVVKGLSNNRNLIDSKILWLGEIPQEWKIKKGKYVLTLLSRNINPSDEIITCFRDGEVTLRSNRRLDGFTISEKEIGYQGIEPGDLIVHGMDGFAGAIGISDSRGKATPVLNVLDSKENKRYLMYFLRRLAYNGIFLALSTGIRVRTCDTNWNKLKELDFIIPSREEQEEIANYLDEKCNDIDKLIASKEKIIEELEKYKKSVIYEYVTGKKEVK